MEVKLAEILEAEAVLLRLSACHPAKAKDTFRLARLQRELRPVFEDYNVARRAMLEEHASPVGDDGYEFVMLDDEGEPVLDDKDEKVRNQEALDRFVEENKALLEESVELSVQPLMLNIFDRLNLDPLVTPAELATIFWLLKDGVNEKAEV